MRGRQIDAANLRISRRIGGDEPAGVAQRRGVAKSAVCEAWTGRVLYPSGEKIQALLHRAVKQRVQKGHKAHRFGVYFFPERANPKSSPACFCTRLGG